jgi:hypothetical protein
VQLSVFFASCASHDDLGLGGVLKPEISFAKDCETKLNELNDVSNEQAGVNAFAYDDDVVHDVRFCSCG